MPRRFLRLHLSALALIAQTAVVAETQDVGTVDRAPGAAKAHTMAQELSVFVPGMAIAVAIDGQTVWSEVFGHADLATKRLVSRTTHFRIGSVSKSLTAAGLVRLVERRCIDLDAPVQTYVPIFPVKPEGTITLRQLAGHLSGIRHFRGREPWMNRHFSTVGDSLSIFGEDPLLSAPGTTFNYSTYGWSLLSAAMESAAGENFGDCMQHEVIDRFGLRHTLLDEGRVDEIDGTTYYEKTKDGRFAIAPTVDLSPTMAGGGFLSTAEDLVHFGSKLLNPGVLGESSLAMLFSPQKTSDGKSTGYGIGWYISGDASGPVYYHTGGSHGGTATLLIRPKSHVVIAMLCNVSDSEIINESMLIADLFAPRVLSRP